MRRLLFTQISLDELANIVTLRSVGIRREPWDELARGELTEFDLRLIDYTTTRLRRVSPSLVNEATVWSRAIYPLLCLAETEDVVAQAEVPLAARIGEVELAGTADGAFGTPLLGELRAPFLIVVEAKRGIEAYNPATQLYGELLAAAWLNARESGRASQQIYGCYTVADDWTFVRADVEGLDTDRPSMTVVSSWEIDEKVEAATIVRILKSIVARRS